MNTSPDLVVTVQDHRPAPQGSKKHIGHGRMVEQSKRVSPWRKAVATAARQAIGTAWTPLDGPLAIEVVFTVRKPKSAPKTRQTWPCTRDSGDIDKLLRSTLDALATDVRAIADDSRVVHVSAIKAFPGEHPGSLPEPGAVIRIWALNSESLPQQRSAA